MIYEYFKVITKLIANLFKLIFIEKTFNIVDNFFVLIVSKLVKWDSQLLITCNKYLILQFSNYVFFHVLCIIFTDNKNKR